jgi:hypothetical protein
MAGILKLRIAWSLTTSLYVAMDLHFSIVTVVMADPDVSPLLHDDQVGERHNLHAHCLVLSLVIDHSATPERKILHI